MNDNKHLQKISVANMYEILSLEIHLEPPCNAAIFLTQTVKSGCCSLLVKMKTIKLYLLPFC